MNRLKKYVAIVCFLISVMLVIIFATPAIALISLLASMLNRESPISLFLELSRDIGLSDFFSVSKVFGEVKKINRVI